MEPRKRIGALALVATVSALAFTGEAARAMPPYEKIAPAGVEMSGGKRLAPGADGSALRRRIDRPGAKDFGRLREREAILREVRARLKRGVDVTALQAKADGLKLSGTDRVLVLLVEFAGTDTFTWTKGVSTWDPLGNPSAGDSTGVPGDCSRIIDETRTFTYSGPLHNRIARPVSASDATGDMIWKEDFTPQHYRDLIAGEGVRFDYARQDGSRVQDDFTGLSVRSYFEDMSGGAYTFEADVFGWLQVPHSVWWYGADECPGAQTGLVAPDIGAIPGAGSAETLVLDALAQLRAQHPDPAFWARYDRDNDGVIDRLWVIHAGLGEEDNPVLLQRAGYGEAAIWSQSSAIVPPREIGPGIKAGHYVIMPENSGIAVLAHEFAHSLGLIDLYSYGPGSTSTGFWSLMADSWTGSPIGFLPAALDPLSLDRLGWLDPLVVSDPRAIHDVTLGQASRFPGGEGVRRGLKIELEDGPAPLPVKPAGRFQWWGGDAALANAWMTLRSPVAIPAGGATLAFRAAWEIEPDWDFLWVQASRDGGATWTTLTNARTSCRHAEGWVGSLNGFPADLCGAGIGGLTGTSAGFPAWTTEQFSLGAFAGANVLLRFWYMTDWGTQGAGPFLDAIRIESGGTTLFADDGESGGGQWTYAGGFGLNEGTKPFSHNLYFQWRNVKDPRGFDYAVGNPRFRYGPANTGLLAWYNNEFYGDNEILRYLVDHFGFGPKGKMLVIDAHPEPYRDPALVARGFDNEAGNLLSGMQMRDAPFSLAPTVDFVVRPPYATQENVFYGRPAVPHFSDAAAYYPGAEFVSRGPGYSPPSFKWITRQWDASVVMPSRRFYGVRAPGYLAGNELRFGCGRLGDRIGCNWYPQGLGYAGSAGTPGDVGGQFGWNVRILRQTDGAARVQAWNAGHATPAGLAAGAPWKAGGGVNPP